VSTRYSASNHGAPHLKDGNASIFGFSSTFGLLVQVVIEVSEHLFYLARLHIGFIVIYSKYPSATRARFIHLSEVGNSMEQG
jgi:hypothetical protein